MLKVTKTKMKAFFSIRNTKFPEMLQLFPVRIEHKSSPDWNNDQQNPGNRGVALLLAVIIVAVMMSFMADLIIGSQVNLQIAVSQRDKIKAEYMAKSGANLAKFLIMIDWGIDIFQAGMQGSYTQDQLSDTLGDIWSTMNGMPIGGETVDMINAMKDQFSLNKNLDSGILDAAKLFDGEFVLDVSDESRKINLSICAESKCDDVMLMLQGLFNCPAEKKFLDEKNIKPDELAFKIKDWIDRDHRAEELSGINDENQPYERKKPPYKAKNAPMDSVDELLQIDGWDAQLQEVFGPYLTVFPYPESGKPTSSSININTASKELLSCITPDVRKADCWEKFNLALAKRAEDNGPLATSGSVKETASSLLCSQSASPASAASGEINRKDPGSWFTKSSQVFRIDVKGEVGEQERRLTLIIQRLYPKLIQEEKKSYRILYWRMI